MKVYEVFTPNDIPTVTYVDRAAHQLEQKLIDFYETPNLVISIAGPSKSGKTVLIKKVVPDDHLITVRGASIERAEDLWNRVLDWMGAPSTVTISSNKSNQITGNAEGGGKIKVPLVAEGEAKVVCPLKSGPP
ncbi:hypothetical protein [Rubellimicrobium arenae]|uniref:hypothetical protein n=1 Tax=Rubellimicrobium arenae TaxID=2817372 RepID=UPI001B300281|nr:hypothetical protein [Rubellimicrobium arenae]